MTLLGRLLDLRRQLDELIEQAQLGDPVAEKLETLRAACQDMNITVSPDGYISEADAARLLDRSPKTLRNWREEHEPIPFRQFGRGQPISYSLQQIAIFLRE